MKVWRPGRAPLGGARRRGARLVVAAHAPADRAARAARRSRTGPHVARTRDAARISRTCGTGVPSSRGVRHKGGPAGAPVGRRPPGAGPLRLPPTHSLRPVAKVPFGFAANRASGLPRSSSASCCSSACRSMNSATRSLPTGWATAPPRCSRTADAQSDRSFRPCRWLAPGPDVHRLCRDRRGDRVRLGETNAGQPDEPRGGRSGEALVAAGRAALQPRAGERSRRCRCATSSRRAVSQVPVIVI